MKIQLKIFILSCIFLIRPNISFSQGVNNVWILGYGGSNTVFNFDSVPPHTHIEQKNMQFLESNASICDNLGNLLFYTNGVKINNRFSQTMDNGDSLNPGPYSSSFQNAGLSIGQGQIIIPFPEDSNMYYLFHETIEFNGNTTQPFNLFYSVIDISADSGRGKVTQKNIPIISDTLVIGEITACKHANGRDWWLIVHRFKSNIFYKLLINPTAIIPSIQNIGTIFRKGSGGQTCISPNGKKYARYHPTDGLDIFDFDRCSGTFSNWQHTDSIGGYGGVAFSPNSEILYVSAELNVYQFNLADTSQSLTNLKYLVAQWDTFYSPNPPFATTFYLSQLAPNGKIYINSTNGVQHMHVINNPDSVGLACDVCQHCISLPTYNAFTVPNHPNYFLGADSGSVCDTLMLGLSTPIKKKVDAAFNYSVKPNPAKDFISVTEIHENSSIRISNSQGLNVYQANLNESTSTIISSASFANGIYYITIQNSNGIKTTKVSILH